jgi:4'-phosphopantetheinyl transferase
VWLNWLYYPSDEHRIAISLRAKENNQTTDYRLRFFESIPLIGMTALTEHLSK